MDPYNVLQEQLVGISNSLQGALQKISEDVSQLAHRVDQLEQHQRGPVDGKLDEIVQRLELLPKLYDNQLQELETFAIAGQYQFTKLSRLGPPGHVDGFGVQGPGIRGLLDHQNNGGPTTADDLAHAHVLERSAPDANGNSNIAHPPQGLQAQQQVQRLPRQQLPSQAHGRMGPPRDPINQNPVSLRMIAPQPSPNTAASVVSNRQFNNLISSLDNDSIITHLPPQPSQQQPGQQAQQGQQSGQQGQQQQQQQQQQPSQQTPPQPSQQQSQQQNQRQANTQSQQASKSQNAQQAQQAQQAQLVQRGRQSQNQASNGGSNLGDPTDEEAHRLWENVPFTRLCPLPKSVQQVLDEYYYGYEGQPPLKYLDKYRKDWRKGNKNLCKTYCRRYRVVRAVEAGVRQYVRELGVTEEQARERVVEELEATRIKPNGKKETMYWLFHNLPAHLKRR